jgi:CIC family chloride channel protein
MTGASVHALSAVVVPAWTGPAGSYALVGLGAFLAGATHAPLTAVFLVFEMTRNYAVVVPALMASSIALLVATRLEPESIDTLGLSAEGKSLHPATDAALLARVPVEAVCRRGVPVISDAASVRETVTAIGEARGTVFPVADGGGRFVGLLPLARLHDALLNDEMRAGGVARDLCDPHGATLPAGTSLADALRLMEADAVDELAVILPGEPPRYVGMLSRADLLAAGNRAVLAATSPLMTDWLSVAAAEPATGAYRVATLPAPPGWIGRTLRDLDTRRRFGVVVLAVNPDRKTASYELPDPDRPFAKTDRVVLAGTEDALRQAREVSA